MSNEIGPSINFDQDERSGGGKTEDDEIEKTPEELEAEKEAMAKLQDIVEIFHRPLIFGITARPGWDNSEQSFMSKKPDEVLQDLMQTKNYFHHLSRNNVRVLKDPNFTSVSCYPFWYRQHGGSGRNEKKPYYAGGEDEVVNTIEITAVLSQEATELTRQNTMELWTKPSLRGQISTDYGDISYDLYHAEALYIGRNNFTRDKTKDISGIILAKGDNGSVDLKEYIDLNTGQVLTSENKAKYDEIINTYKVEFDKLTERYGHFERCDRDDPSSPKELFKVYDSYLSEKTKYYREQPASFESVVAVAKTLGRIRNVPVFDGDGNMVWPRQMKYEEVKAFVAERDAKKAQNQPETELEENPVENPEE